MRVIFIHHSCFLVEADEKVLLFDWFDGDKLEEHHFGGVLPEYEPDTPFYVFASHKHRDHFDLDVLRLADRYKDIHFILSKDCKMTPRFLEKHGISSAVRDKITYVGAGEKREVAGVKAETLRSTDAGVAFYVETNGICLYHAGDLNNWRWEGAGDLINGQTELNYKVQMKRLAGKKIHLAFLPLDPRLGQYQSLGMDYFLEHVNADYIFPMHMWRDYSGIADYKKKISNAAKADRIVEIKCENQIFEIAVE